MMIGHTGELTGGVITRIYLSRFYEAENFGQARALLLLVIVFIVTNNDISGIDDES